MNRQNNNNYYSKNNSLHLACKDNNIDVCRMLINTGADINSQDKFGQTSLNIASWYGHKDICQFLINNGAKPYIKSQKGYTPLDSASFKRHSDIQKLLLQNELNNQLISQTRKGNIQKCTELIANGADINFQDQFGCTPLNIASWLGFYELSQLLIQKSANINIQNKRGSTPLQSATQKNHKNICDLLQPNGSRQSNSNYIQDQQSYTDPNTQINIDKLVKASQQGDIHQCQLLINNGVNPNLKNSDGKTPLTQASFFIHIDVCKLLIQNGANVNLCCKHYHSPLEQVIFRLHSELQEEQYNLIHQIVLLLLQNGANPNFSSSYGSPLYTTVKYSLQLTQMLVNYGANIHYQNYTFQETAIFNASANTCQFLIDNGADVNALTKSGDNVLITLADRGHVDACQILINNGININAQNKDGDTALHRAAYHAGSPEAVQILLDHGADLNILNNNGKTAYQLTYDFDPIKRKKVLDVLQNYSTHKCSLCLDYISTKEFSCRICKQQFHLNCIGESLRHDSRCPLCRKHI